MINKRCKVLQPKSETLTVSAIDKSVRISHHQNCLSRFEIRYYLKRMLNTEVISEEVVERIKSKDVVLYWDGMTLLTDFCNSTGIAPYGWGQPSFGWNPDYMRTWCLLHWDKFSLWCADKKEST